MRLFPEVLGDQVFEYFIDLDDFEGHVEQFPLLLFEKEQYLEWCIVAQQADATDAPLPRITVFSGDSGFSGLNVAR
jgi:hypothetical protein